MAGGHGTVVGAIYLSSSLFDSPQKLTDAEHQSHRAL